MINIYALTEEKMRIVFYFGLILLLLSGCVARYEGLDEIRNQLALLEAQVAYLNSQLRQYEVEAVYEPALHTQIVVHEREAIPQTQPPIQPQAQPQTLPRLPDSMTLDEMSRLYNQGLRHYEARDFAAAIRDFTAVATHSQNNDLVANSIYWTGEAYFAMADFTAARTEFQRIQDQFPNSNKFVDAQVKIAMTWIRQGRRDLARGILEAIRRDFPNYERMNVVDQQLRLIRG